MILGRNEGHLQPTEQLRAGNGHDAEVEKDAKQRCHGDLANDRRGENRAADENVHADVGQPLVLDLDQASLFARSVRIAVLGQTSDVSDASHGRSTDPGKAEQATDRDEQA